MPFTRKRKTEIIFLELGFCLRYIVVSYVNNEIAINASGRILTTFLFNKCFRCLCLKLPVLILQLLRCKVLLKYISDVLILLGHLYLFSGWNLILSLISNLTAFSMIHFALYPGSGALILKSLGINLRKIVLVWELKCEKL